MEMASSRVVTVVGGGIDFRPPVGDDLGWDADDEVCLSVGIGAGSEMNRMGEDPLGGAEALRERVRGGHGVRNGP